MAALIENYGLIGDLFGSALVSRDGSIDWLCMPRFDSDACMAGLLGRDEHGCWLIHPDAEVLETSRRYRPGTVIHETTFECDGGAVRVIDFMPVGGTHHSVVRIVEGVRGTVPMMSWLVARLGYGRSRPMIDPVDGGARLTVGPDSLTLRTSAPIIDRNHNLRSHFEVKEGERVAFSLTWEAAYRDAPPPVDATQALAETERFWREWSGRSTYKGAHKDAVNRSLLTLKAMTYQPSGGIVAAPTMGLPEELGGVRNWDYRFCWLRDASLTLEALVVGGYLEEAQQWGAWLMRACAGAPADLQIMYGLDGERRLTEFEVPWLPGYEESRPVRIGNAASDQFQLDVYGEVFNAMYEAMRHGLHRRESSRTPGRDMLEFVGSVWQRPDDGIWEVRGGRRHFVHSKVMAWVAADRYARVLEEYVPEGDKRREALPVVRGLRDRIHRDICEHGFNTRLNTFVQSYGSDALDATLLLIPALGFLPANDPRVLGTIDAVERGLLADGFVRRYATEHTDDGLAGTEGVFLACSFWLVDAYTLVGRHKDAERLFERLIDLRNELGLLSEEYDTNAGRLIGNFPQAFSHLALIHSAAMLDAA